MKRYLSVFAYGEWWLMPNYIPGTTVFREEDDDDYYYWMTVNGDAEKPES